MTWLEERLNGLRRMAEDSAAPSCYRQPLAALLREVASRDGVTACFACHEGLLVDAAGIADFDAFAALAQQLAAAADQSSRALGVGDPEQLLIVGRQRKLALLVVPPFAIGVVAQATVRLAQALADRATPTT